MFSAQIRAEQKYSGGGIERGFELTNPRRGGGMRRLVFLTTIRLVENWTQNHVENPTFLDRFQTVNWSKTGRKITGIP